MQQIEIVPGESRRSVIPRRVGRENTTIWRGGRGFTIVELLIVIVVIAILAAITIVAYNGIQQRANNSARISAAGQVVKLVSAWRAINGDGYPPASGGGACLTKDDVCTKWDGTPFTSGSTTTTSALGQIGTLPESVPKSGSGSATVRYGIFYNYRGAATMTFNDEPAHILIMYWLDGTDQDCGLGNVAVQGTVDGTHPDPWKSSTTGYTASIPGSNQTSCFIAM